MAEDTVPPGAGGILGVNNLQRAVDGFDRAVETLSGIVGKIGNATTEFNRGSSNAGSWNKFSNWAGSLNGGNATFNGQPANGGGSGGSGGGNGGTPLGGSHRASGPASYWGTSPTGSPHRAPGNGIGKAMAAAGMASQTYQNMTQSKSDSNQDSMLMLTTAGMASFGSQVNARSMFNNTSWALNTQDAAGAMGVINQNAGGLAGGSAWNQLRNGVASATLANPMMSGSQAAQVVTSFYQPAAYNKLATVGVNTINMKTGKRQSPTQIANQVLNQIDPHQSIRDENAAAQLVTDPLSPLNVTLGNWVSNGIISGDMVGEIKDQIQTILKARMHGVGVNQLQNLMNQRAAGSVTAAKKLTSMQIGSTPLQREKDLAAAQRQPTVDRLPDFEKSLDQAIGSVEGFTNVLRKFTSDPSNPIGSEVGKIMARWRGGTSHGFLGTLGAAANGLGAWLSNPLSLGGSNETRMSVQAGGGSVGGSSTSGEPHHAGASAMGGASVGGPAGQGAAGGHSDSKGGGQRLQWPCKGPITARFGQSGTHWSSGSHTGIDIGVKTGTPITAAGSGRVIFAGYNSAYGNLIKIDHGGGVVTLYGHNSRLVVHANAQVRQGQLVAYSGATGNVTGPHCHFEVDVNGNPVDPMKYLSGGATVAGSGSSGANAGTSGSGTTTNNGSSTAFGGGASTVGMSELDVLSGALSGGSGFNSDSGTSAGSSGGTVSPGASGSVPYTPSKGVEQWRGTVVKAMQQLGLNTAKSEVDRVLMQMTTESGGNPSVVNKWDVNWQAGHPSVGLLQVIGGTFNKYAGPYGKTGPFEYGVSTNPMANIYSALNYAVHQYGSIDNAFHGHGYDKGAWELPNDETARVHKGEMIIPKKEADQIREILVNGNPYGATSNQSSDGATITFGAGSISIHVTSSGNPQSDGRAIGKAFMDTVNQHKRIIKLQKGVKK